MVEINNRNVRRSSICWRGRRDPITDVRNQKSWLWRHCRRRAIYWLLRSPSQTCHAKPKTQITRRWTLPASFPLVGCLTASSLAWKTSLRKVRTLWHCSRLASVALTAIDRGDIRQAIDRCSNIWASLPGAGYGQLEHKADSLIAKFKEAGGTVREIDVWAESPRLSPLWLSASPFACHGLLIITVITPLPTAQRDKNARELKLANAAITDMQMRQRDVAALDAKYTKELAKAENDALRDDVAAGRRRLHIKAVCQSVREATTPPAWIMQPPPDWQTPLNGIISPSERGWSLCKNNWKEPRRY